MSAPRGQVVILGGGVAGLAAGYYLTRADYSVTVVEKAPVVGGLCASFKSDGFTLDHGPHKLYSVVPGILEEIRRLLGDELIEHQKLNRIRLLDRFLDYPVRLGNLLPLLGPVRSMRLGLGYAGALGSGLLGGREARSYEEYILQRFGRGVYELVFEPLAWKVWGDPSQISVDLARARIPGTGPGDALLRLLRLKKTTEQDDAPFFYYPRSGFGAFPDRLARGIEAGGGRILTGATPVKLERQNGAVRAVEVQTEGGSERLECDTLVSSVPMQVLAKLAFPEDASVAEDVARLKFRDLLLVFLFIERDRVMKDHWIFFPERRFPFNRVFEQKAMSAEMGPAGRTALCCDITCDEGGEMWKATDATLQKRCFEALTEAGLVEAGSLGGGLVKRFRRFYPMYGLDYRDRLRGAYAQLRGVSNLVLTGRLGMFNYNNSDHCLDMGRFLAQGLASGLQPGEVWEGLEERVRTYRIID